MSYEFLRVLQDEVKNVLVYPKDLVSTIDDVLRLLQLTPYELSMLRKEKAFSEVQILGVIFFENKELFHWAYWHRPQVIQMRLPFNQEEGNL